MRDLFFLGFFVSAAVLSLQTPVGAVLLWTWLSQITPNDFLFGLASYIPFQKVAAPLAIIAWAVAREKKRLTLDMSLAAMLLFLLLGTVSELATPFQFGRGAYLLSSVPTAAALAWLVACTMTNRPRLHAYVLSICIGLGYVAVWEGTLFFVTGGGHKVLGDPSHGDNNEIALLTDMTIPLVFWVARQSRNRAVRIVCLIVGVLFIGCVVGTRSRGGFAGLAVLGIFAALFSRRKIAATALVLVLAVGFMAVVPASWTDRMDSIQNASGNESFLGRVEAWKESTVIALDRPLLGAGYYGVENPAVWIHYLEDADALPFPIKTGPLSPDHLHAAHSVYFQVLGDEGFLGFLLYFGMIAGAFWNAERVRWRARKRPDLLWAASLARAMEGGLLMLLTAGGLLSTAYYQLPFLLIGGLSALNVTVRQAVAAENPGRQRRRPASRLPAGTAPAGAAPAGMGFDRS